MAAVETVFNFNIDQNGGYIDLAQCMSAIGRKLERQQQQFVIQSIELQASEVGTVDIQRLPNNWVTVNAINKAYYHWKAQQDDAAEEAGLESTEGRYRDFKIFMSATHADAGTDNNLVPQNTQDWGSTTAGTTYSWTASQIAVPNQGSPGNTTEYYLHVIGDDNGSTSKGLIKAYAESRARPQQEDPNIVDVAGGGLYGLMDDVGDNMVEIINNYQTANDAPPYLVGDVSDEDSDDQEYYWGGANNGSTINECRLISNATGGNIRTTAGGFVANCGLLSVTVDGLSDAILKIRLAADDRGYITRPMLEGN